MRIDQRASQEKSRNLLMGRNALACFTAEPGTKIVVESGEVWVTEESNREDLVLGAGDEHFFTGRRKIVLEALEQSLVKIQPQVLLKLIPEPIVRKKALAP